MGPFLFPVILLVLAFLGWAAVYAYDKGFSKKWRGFVRKEFRERGVEIDFAKLTLDPLQGLVARDVRIYDSEERQFVLASITGIKLDADLISVITKRSFINSIDLDNAQLSLPIDPLNPDGERLEIGNITARAYFLRDKVEVRRVTGDLGDIDFELSGALFVREEEAENSKGKKASKKPPSIDAEALRQWRGHLANLSSWLERVKFSGPERPSLRVQIEGDVSSPEAIRGNLRFLSGPLEIAGAEFDTAAALIEMRQAELVLKELEMVQDDRQLLATGFFLPDEKKLQLQIDSEVDLPAVAAGVFDDPGLLAEIVFYEPPLFKAEGTWDFDAEPGQQLSVVGSLSSSRFASRGVVFGGTADFSLADGRVLLRNVEIDHQTGSFSLQSMRDSQGFRYDASLRMNPSVFAPFVRADRTRDFLNSFKLGRDSSFRLDLSGGGPSMDSREWTSLGTLDLRDTEFRGTLFSRLEADLEVSGVKHKYSNVRLARPEGSMQAQSVSVDMSTGRTEIQNLVGDVDAVAVMRCFHRPTSDRLKAYRFQEHPSVSVSGFIAGREADTPSDLEIKFQSAQACQTELLGRTWSVSPVAGQVRLIDGRVDTRLEGGVFGGTLNLGCTNRGGVTQGEVRATRLGFDRLVAFLDGQSTTGGEFALDLQFRSDGRSRRSFEGSGAARLAGGNIFSIPVFGPLTPLIDGLLPRELKSYGVAHTANMGFDVRDGVLRTDSLEALTKAFRLSVDGEIDLESYEIAADASLNLKGAPGILLSPVSKLLEFHASGPAMKPVWVPKRLVRPLGGKARLDAN